MFLKNRYLDSIVLVSEEEILAINCYLDSLFEIFPQKSRMDIIVYLANRNQELEKNIETLNQKLSQHKTEN